MRLASCQNFSISLSLALIFGVQFCLSSNSDPALSPFKTENDVKIGSSLPFRFLFERETCDYYCTGDGSLVETNSLIYDVTLGSYSTYKLQIPMEPKNEIELKIEFKLLGYTLNMHYSVDSISDDCNGGCTKIITIPSALDTSRTLDIEINNPLNVYSRFNLFLFATFGESSSEYTDSTSLSSAADDSLLFIVIPVAAGLLLSLLTVIFCFRRIKRLRLQRRSVRVVAVAVVVAEEPRYEPQPQQQDYSPSGYPTPQNNADYYANYYPQNQSYQPQTYNQSYQPQTYNQSYQPQTYY